MPKLIGITGTIGSGKSTVGNILASLAVPVIDTDVIVHDLLEHSGSIREAVIRRFGKQIIKGSEHEVIDRIRLGQIVFADASARRDLESIIHPAVLEEMRQQIMAHSDRPAIAVLVPLLFEAGIEGEFGEIWTVVTSESVLLERLKQRDGLSESDIKKRLSAQMPQSEKASRSHHTIDNSDTLENTRKQVAVLLADR